MRDPRGGAAGSASPAAAGSSGSTACARTGGRDELGGLVQRRPRRKLGVGAGGARRAGPRSSAPLTNVSLAWLRQDPAVHRSLAVLFDHAEVKRLLTHLRLFSDPIPVR